MNITCETHAHVCIQAVLACQSFHFQELLVDKNIVILYRMQHIPEML